MPTSTEELVDAFPASVSWASAALTDAGVHRGVELNLAERARAGGYLPGRPREDFVAGRILVRVLAARLLDHASPALRPYLPQDLELVQHCPGCGSLAHGAPRLRVPKTGQSFAMSYARTSGWLLVALAPGHSLLGADLADLGDAAFAPGDGDLLEDYAYAPAERLHLRSLAPAERPAQRARWWALKEAVAKADGEGLAGAGGIPVVAGPARHRLLRGAGTEVVELESGAVDTLGQAFGPNLTGSILWVPDTAA